MRRRLAAPLVGIAICLFHIIPFFIMVNVALKTRTDTSSKWVTPAYLYVDNFVNAWKKAHLDRALLNNIIITTAAVTVFCKNKGSVELSARLATSLV